VDDGIISVSSNMLKICFIRWDKPIDFAAENVGSCTAEKIFSICSGLAFIYQAELIIRFTSFSRSSLSIGFRIKRFLSKAWYSFFLNSS
jgi:hypothetical protein